MKKQSTKLQLLYNWITISFDGLEEETKLHVSPDAFPFSERNTDFKSIISMKKE